ncbi:MAG: membrane protein insertion efficiency factor YidD [Terriglobia bacterium]
MTPTSQGERTRLQRGLEQFVLAGIRFYQAALRPMNPWGCKFYPSCSNYALEAVEYHGLGRGLWLGLRRLLRCRPGVFGGYDPVPEHPHSLRPPARAARAPLG